MITHLLPIILAIPLSGSWDPTCAIPAQEEEKQVIVRTAPGKQGYLGVQITDLTTEKGKELKAKAKEGAVVVAVTEESPAEKAGIAENDVIIEFNGRTIYDSEDLTKAVRRVPPGTSVTVVVDRKGQKKSLKATVGKAESMSFNIAIPRVPSPRTLGFFYGRHSEYGLSLMELNPQLRKYFGAPEGKGVLVEEVQEGSAGEKAGFAAGDVILRIGSEPIEELEDIPDGLEDFKEGEKAEVEILRKGTQTTIALPIEEATTHGEVGRGTSGWKALRHLEELRPEMYHLQRELDAVKPELDRLRLHLEHERGARDKALENFRVTLKKAIRPTV
jgi:S1-C subfamily serine protease